jgi:O-methyltransferase involved in polyketide biosynthesis
MDLNDDAWPDLDRWLMERTKTKALVLMEGVSPYVNDSTFGRFLSLLAHRLSVGSRVAFDFKIRGANDNLGRGGRTLRPFRLSGVREEVAAFHEKFGYRLEHMELSSELSARLLPGLVESGASLFRQDALVQLQIGRT